MTQARRTSAKLTTKQIHSEVMESLKNFSQQSYEVTIPETITAPVKPRRPPLHHANEMATQNYKAHFTKPEPQYKPSEANEFEKTTLVPSSAVLINKSVEKSVRYVVSKNLCPGSYIKMIISLPTDLPRMSGIDLTNIIPSDSADGLESVSKSDLQFLDGSFPSNYVHLLTTEPDAIGSGITFSTGMGNYTSKQDEIPPEVDSSESGISDESDNHDIKELSVDSLELDHTSDSLQNVANDEQSTAPVDEHTHTVPVGDVSPASNTCFPKAPPSTPLLSKREIKLVTAGSSAVYWFTHGLGHFISTEENRGPIIVPSTLQQTGQQKTECAQTSLVNLAEPDTKEQGNDSADFGNTVPKMTCTSDFATLLIFIADIPVDPQAASTTIVVDTSLLFSFNICRPYLHRPADSQSSPTAASFSLEKPSMSDTEKEPVPILRPENVQSSITIADETAADQRLDDIAIVQAASSIYDMEGVKRKWLREEVYQDPVYSSKPKILTLGVQ
jgi:hypothetical protein